MSEFYSGPIFVTNPNFGKPKTAWEEESAPDESKKSFYPHFRKFAYLCRCLGCFPVNISKSSSKLTFSWDSAWTVFSVLALPMALFIYLILYPIQDPVFRIFVFFFLLNPVCLKVLFIRKIPSLIKLVCAMDSLDRDPCLKESDPDKTRKDYKFVIIFTLTTTILATFPIRIILHGIFQDIFGLYWVKFLTIFFQVSQMSLFYVVCYQMNHFYDRFSTALEALSETPCKEVKEEVIESYRLTHARLVTCVRLMDDTFGTWIGFVYVTTSCWFVIACYLSIYGTNNLHHVITLVQVILILFFIYYPAVLSDHIYNKVCW